MAKKELKLDVNVKYKLIEIETDNATKSQEYIDDLISALEEAGVSVVNNTNVNKSISECGLYVTHDDRFNIVMCDKDGVIVRGQRCVDTRSRCGETSTATIKVEIAGVWNNDKNN